MLLLSQWPCLGQGQGLPNILPSRLFIFIHAAQIVAIAVYIVFGPPQNGIASYAYESVVSILKVKVDIHFGMLCGHIKIATTLHHIIHAKLWEVPYLDITKAVSEIHCL